MKIITKINSLIFLRLSYIFGIIIGFGAFSCSNNLENVHEKNPVNINIVERNSSVNFTDLSKSKKITEMTQKLDTAVFGGGCFWCTEAVFLEVKGVQAVEPGYSGGSIINPTYEDVCTGTTGHAEVIRIIYDPTAVAYQELLEIFFLTHDPTTLNQQGADIGTQYRSTIFYTSENQKIIAQQVLNRLTFEKAYPSPILTVIEPLEIYFSAENYHHGYYSRNQNQSYCRFVIQPKLEKFRKAFSGLLKDK